MASEWPRTTLIPWRAREEPLGERLGIAAITIVFGIGTKTGAKELRQPIIFRGRKDFLPVEPQGCLSFLILLGEPRFA